MAITVHPVEDRDIPAMAQIRAARGEDGAFWSDRIARYIGGKHWPRFALSYPAVFVALEEDHVVGFVAGHRTRRLACEG
jgi:hypothetical protein